MIFLKFEVNFFFLYFQRYLLFLAADNTLQDCDGIAEGSAIDSEIIQDYKKGNQKHLQLNPNKTSKKVNKIAFTEFVISVRVTVYPFT
jgi:hypothetical protein